MQTELDIVLNTPKLSLTRARDALVSNYEEVQRLRVLTESLLMLARNEQPALSPQDIQPLIASAITQVETFASSRSIIVTSTIPPGTTAQVHATSLVQAIVALLDNAIKYSPKDSTVYVTCEQESDHILISVTDKGAGIAPAELPHLKKRFYRAKSSQNTDGHGLGLSIVERISIWHGTPLRIQSVLGTGSIFTITLKK